MIVFGNILHMDDAYILLDRFCLFNLDVKNFRNLNTYVFIFHRSKSFDPILIQEFI